MNRKHSVKIITAAGSLILIGLFVAVCVLSRVDKADAAKSAAGSQDPYVRLEKQLAERRTYVDYDGFVFSLKDRTDEETVQRIDEAIRSGAELTELTYTPGTYCADTLEDIREVVDTEDIESIEPDNEFKICDDLQTQSVSAPNDSEYDKHQYNLRTLNVPAVWEKGMEGQDLDLNTDLGHDGSNDDGDMIIAVIDSGYKFGHEDMDETRILPGKTLIAGSEESPMTDINGHGTRIAGILTAVKGNGIGIAGIGQHIKVLPIRVFAGDTGQASDIINAVNYVTEQRITYDQTAGSRGVCVSVINMSMSSNEPSEGLKKACENAKKAGIIIVSAAGNDSNTASVYPAQYTMGVGSTDMTGRISSFSQRLSTGNGTDYANKVWVTAPGEQIYCPDKTASEYTSVSGTSFSAPQVAALAALCKSLRNDYTQAEFMALLRATAVSRDGSSGKINGQDVEYGWGQVDFERAIRAIPEKQAPKEQPVEPAAGKEYKPLGKVTGLRTTGHYRKRSFTVSFDACPGADKHRS